MLELHKLGRLYVYFNRCWHSYCLWHTKKELKFRYVWWKRRIHSLLILCDWGFVQLNSICCKRFHYNSNISISTHFSKIERSGKWISWLFSQLHIIKSILIVTFSNAYQFASYIMKLKQQFNFVYCSIQYSI